MKKLSLAYFGSPSFSALFLEKLFTDTTINQLIEVKLVVTQPDQPVGRKQILTPAPVKQVAQKYKINVADGFKSYIELLPLLKDIDMVFLFAYGITLGIIPKELLDLPKFGFLNTHPSLLPLYRGASPMVYPLILGDEKTGVTLIKLDEEIDHGPIIAQKEILIGHNDLRPDIELKLSNLAYKLFKKTVEELIKNPTSSRLRGTTQDHSKATFTRQLEKSDGFIPLPTLKKALNNEPLNLKELPKIIMEYINKYNLIGNWKLEIGNSSKIIFNYFKGLYPWPGIWSIVKIKGQDKRLKITDMDLIDGQLILKKVQLEGKKEVDFKTFNRAYSTF